MNTTDLTEDNLSIFAAKHYYNPLGVDVDEFHEDLKRFKYVKRLLNRYIETDNMPDRLVLNHLIVIFNVFGIEAGLAILELKLDRQHWPVIKPFLVFLKTIRTDQYTNIPQDWTVVEMLRKI